MKIAIIEDRIWRLEQYSEFDLKSCKEVTLITASDFDQIIILLKERKTEFLSKYDCIASHRSALKNENVDETIKEFCKANKKPLIFFSGGITSSIYKDNIFPFLLINSKDFYSANLKYFIDNSEENVNLLKLQFGKRWKLTMLLNLRNNIAVAQNKHVLKNENPDIEIDDKELMKRVIHLHINSLIKPDLINEKTVGFLSGNDTSSISAEQLQEVKFVINNLINNML